MHGSVPPSPSRLPGQGVPLGRGPLVISGTWGLYSDIYCWLGGGLLFVGFFKLFFLKIFFFPLLSFALPGFSPSCGFGVDRSEGLECAGSDRPPSG